MRSGVQCTAWIYSFLLVAFSVQEIVAQYDEKNFIQYTIKDGLSDNYVTSLMQDDLGYMWIGTDVGLNRFDGFLFKNYYRGSLSLTLPSSGIRDLRVMGHDHLGILSTGGLQVLNSQDYSLQNYFIPDTTSFITARNAVWDAEQLSDNTILITTAAGIYQFDSTGRILFRFEAYSQKDIGQKRVLFGRDIMPLNDDLQLVFAENEKLFYFRKDLRKLIEINRSDDEWKRFYPSFGSGEEYWLCKQQLNRQEFIFFHPQKDSIIYYNRNTGKYVSSALPFSSTKEVFWDTRIEFLNDSLLAMSAFTTGFYLFDLNRRSGKITFHPEKYLPRYKINCLYMDKDRRLWIGTSQGVLKQKLTAVFAHTFSYPSLGHGNEDHDFLDVFRYKNKLYLCGSSRTKGLLIIDTATMKPEKEIFFYGRDSQWNQMASMQMYHPDTLWLGAYPGLLWFDTKSNRYGKVLNDTKYNDYNWQPASMEPVHEDGYAWFCYKLNGVVGRYHVSTREFTFFTAETKPVLPFSKVKSIVYDSYGDVWLGGHSLSRWNNGNMFFDTLITVYGGENKYNDDIVTLSADDHGSLWLHNAFNGLLQYQIEEKKFRAYSMKDGLPEDVFQSFSPVIDENLWLSSNSHLTMFNTQTKEITVFNQEDGLSDQRPTSRKIYYDQESDYFYILCSDDIVRFHSYHRDVTSRAEIIFQELIANSTIFYYHLVNEIHLKAGENNLALNFTIIDFESANNYRFAYKIGPTESWSALGQQRSVNLTSLQPGKYNLELKATGKSGEPVMKKLTFFIDPPFWKTNWFVWCSILFLALSIYTLYRYRIKQLRQKANLDKLISQTEMKALHAQMNPHFIFNSLNSIREMILNNETREASRYLGNFAHLIRITLDQSRQSFISLRSTMDYLNRYIEMEKIRNSDFHFNMEADESLEQDETILPPMLIQPFIENAIWHGMNGDEMKINIRVQFKKNKDQLVCIIDDDGIGIHQALAKKNNVNSKHQSVSISNIKNRIELLNRKYDLRSSILVEDKSTFPGKNLTGTIVTITLPLEMTEE